MHIKVECLGEPKAQKRHRHFTPKGAKFTSTYDPSKSDKKDFLSVIQQNAPAVPLDEPIAVELTFIFGRPKSHYGTGKNSTVLKPLAPNYHVSKPDVDNLFKFVTDAMTKTYWRDDSLICATKIVKQYGDMPKTVIEINTITKK